MKTEVLFDGQPYVDEPQYVINKPKRILSAICDVLHVESPRPVKELTGHERVKLRWMKYENGKFTPR